MSTWPSEGRQENDREEELAEVTVRLLTAAGPAQQQRLLMEKTLLTLTYPVQLDYTYGQLIH